MLLGGTGVCLWLGVNPVIAVCCDWIVSGVSSHKHLSSTCETEVRDAGSDTNTVYCMTARFLQGNRPALFF